MRFLLPLLLLAACGCPEPDPQTCLPDSSWCLIAEPDGGARIIGAP